MRFENRAQAGKRLAERLLACAGEDPLVLAIPRGGIPVGRAVADALGGDLDVILVHKLRSPDNREFAIGSVAEDGHIYLSAEARTLGVSESYLKEEVAFQLEALRRRRSKINPVRPPIDPFGRLVIVVDDGLATGFTMIAALRSLRTRRPARVVAAVPVAPRGTLQRVGPWANEIVCLETPEPFGAVGACYHDFSAVSDEQAVELLRRAPVPVEPSNEDF
ncbi:MAG TPA: phosphoribosyltransferase family protein [Planctomycetota bacterium]|nr:phosphoribosyltransferase family protein [Planctomycetota bacterium]